MNRWHLKHFRDYRITLKRRAFAVIIGLDCSEEENRQLDEVSADHILHIGKCYASWLRVKPRFPRLRVVCFGAGVSGDRAPEALQQLYAHEVGGLWSAFDGLAVVKMAASRPHSVEQIILHELGHALLDLLTRYTRFPMALNEGFAFVAMEMFTRREGSRKAAQLSAEDWERIRAYANEIPFIGIRELLGMTYDAADEDARGHWRICQLSYWMVMFLLQLGKDRPLLKTILSETGRQRISEPDRVFEWICTTAQMKPADIEEAFDHYCHYRPDSVREVMLRCGVFRPKPPLADSPPAG